MSTKKITDLTLISSATAGLSLPADDGIQSYRTTIQQISDFILGAAKVPLSALNLTIFNGLTAVTAATDDYMVIADTSDSSKTKKALISDIFNNNVRSVTTTDAAALTDRTLIFSGASFTETLPTAVGNAGKVFELIHNGTNFSQAYTLGTTSGQTIGGVAGGSYVLYTNGETLVVVSDNANWLIKEHKTKTPIADAGAMTPTNTSGYIFTITSASATAGAVYSNNSQLFYVTLTIASSTTLTCSGTGAPTSSGTLTLVSGSGAATITYSSLTTNNPSKGTMTIVSDKNLWYRDGQFLKGRIEFASSAAGTASSGTGDHLFWPLSTYNANIQIDTTLLTANGGAAWLSSQPTQISGVVGTGWGKSVSASPSGALSLMAYDSTKLRMAAIDMASNFTSGNACGVGSGHLGFAAAPCYSINYAIPIVGWRP